MNDINVLPFTVVQKLEEAGIPQDSLIFFKNDRWIYQRGHVNINQAQVRYQTIDSLGPFGRYLNIDLFKTINILFFFLNIGINSVDVSFTLFPDTSEYTIIKIGKRQLNDEEKISGTFAPIAEITLAGFARSIANIPENATHFCWLYPPINALDVNNIDFDSQHELNLLKIGGFAYFFLDTDHGDTLQLLRVNSLSESATNGITFDGPYPWPKEFTNYLWNKKRFYVSFFCCLIYLQYYYSKIILLLCIQPVTLPSLLDKGARYFAFINPFEFLLNENDQAPWMPSPNGAFAYLFNEDRSPHTFDCYFSVADDCLGAAPSDADQ